MAPVLAQERYGGRPIYFSDLVVREGTGGTAEPSWRIAYNDKESFSGWIAPRWGLAALGLEPDAMTWVVTGSHLVSLEAVSKGAADAAGIDSMVLDLVSGDAAPGGRPGHDRELRPLARPADLDVGRHGSSGAGGTRRHPDFDARRSGRCPPARHLGGGASGRGRCCRI